MRAAPVNPTSNPTLSQHTSAYVSATDAASNLAPSPMHHRC